MSAVEGAIGRRVRRHLLLRLHRLRATFRPPTNGRSVDNGQTLHINLESREFAKPGRPDVRWSAVAAGDFDATLTQRCEGIGRLHKPFFITFDHEADNKAKLAARGTPAQFVAAWRTCARSSTSRRHAGDLDVGGDRLSAATTRRCRSSTRATTAWTGSPGIPTTRAAARTATSAAIPRRRSLTSPRPFYDWLATTGAKAGISLKKPYMISETGSAYDPKDPQATAAFYASIPAGLKRLPRIRAVTLWPQSAGDCNYQISGIPQLQPALRAAAQQLQHLSS